MCATRMQSVTCVTPPATNRFRFRLIRQAFLLQSLLISPLAVSQIIQTGGGSDHEMEGEDDCGLPKYPFGDALQEYAQNPEENPYPDAPQRQVRPSPEETAGNPKPAHPQRRENRQADPAHLADRDNPEIMCRWR